MKLQQFDGGASTRLAPQLLNINQGVVYENIDNAQGILTPNKDKTITAIAVDRYQKYFNAEDTWVSSATQTDYLEFQQVMYSTDRINKPQKTKNGVTRNLGIDAPTQKPVLTLNEEASPVIDLTILNKTDNVLADLPAGDLNYLLFNVNSGLYSRPYAFTVFGSNTTSTRVVAAGYVDDTFLDDATLAREISLANPITTEETIATRSIQFKDFLGDIQDEVALYRFYSGAWRRVFISATTPGFQYNDITYDISAQPELDLDDITAFNGTYQYVYTFYNSTDGTESAPSPLSDELRATSGRIFVQNLEIASDPQVDFRRLYRVGGSITEFTLVAEIPNDIIVAYNDQLKDDDLLGDLLISDNYQPAPEGLKYLSESYAMLFGALGSSLRFTPIGVPNAWPPEFEIQFDAEITGLGPVANGLLVFTRSKTFIVTGTGPTSLAQQSLRGDQGCIAFESIAEAYEGTLIWASEDGLCISSGNDVKNITKMALGEIKLDPVSAAVNDEVYYCHNSDGTTIAWDYRFNPIPKYLNLQVESFAVALGVLYGYQSGFLYSLFSNSNDLVFNYLSPLFVEGSFTESKTYKKFFIRSSGVITLVIYIDGNIASTFNLTTTDTHQLQVPQHLQRGYSIQFEITGTGTVQELEYIVGPRQNG